ncbi:MAG: glycine betaine ABC transporter substrate-binding protein [Lentisphaeria bacterium]
MLKLVKKVNMKKALKRTFGGLVALALLSTVSTGCKKQTQESEEAASKGTVDLVYVNWAEGIAMTNLAKTVLEEEMGYDVTLTMADAAPVFTSLASGDRDAFMDAWLPVTHKSYMEKYGDDLVDLGINNGTARIGLVVPEYVTIDSIEEINANKDKFEGEIIGIDSGAGIMKATNKAIDEYGLDLELISSSGPAMTAALKKAVAQKEWIAVTGWKPHWKFARWDLKFLDDPKGIYGAVEKIHTVARKGLKEEMPEVTQFLSNFQLDDTQLASLMGAVKDAQTPAKGAAAWMEDNMDLVQSWTPAE